MSRRVKKATHASQVRIIGGQWRGSRLSVADRPGLRPTPDRVRETLFNWLAMDIAGAAVLDCFAGSGALGLEAASRGASQVILVEKDRQVAGKLHDNCIRLNADSVSVFTVDVLSYLESCSDGFDVVFIDPPYADASLRNQVLDILIKRQLLNDECKVYLEWPDDQHMALESPALYWLKQKTAGHVVYAIAQWRYTG